LQAGNFHFPPRFPALFRPVNSTARDPLNPVVLPPVISLPLLSPSPTFLSGSAYDSGNAPYLITLVLTPMSSSHPFSVRNIHLNPFPCSTSFFFPRSEPRPPTCTWDPLCQSSVFLKIPPLLYSLDQLVSSCFGSF